MGLVRTAKSLVGRLDNRYITRPNRGRLFRRTLIAVCSFAVLVGWGVYVGRGDKTPYSPGPLTSAHGMWDGNNCGWCHEPKPGGGFVLTVSNDACTRCHDGSVHHPNVGMQFTPAGGGPARDAGTCTSCHVEHRGHDRLVARADNTCTQCHADLAPTAAKPELVAVQPKVTAFAVGAHPAFGRSLTDDKKWAASAPVLRDPTPLRYNHKKHQETDNAKTPPLAGQAENCTACHRSAGGDPNLGDIAPISYARDCAGCHKLELAAGLPLPHVELQTAVQAGTALIAGLQSKALRDLAAMPEEDRKKELDKLNPAAAQPAAPAGGGGGPFGRKPAAAPAPVPPTGNPFGRRPAAGPAGATAAAPAPGATAPAPPTTEQLTEWWVNAKLQPYALTITQWYNELKDGEAGATTTEYKTAVGLPDELPAVDAKTLGTNFLWRDERVLALYTAYKTTGAACAKCHDLSAAPPKPEQSLAELVRLAGPPMSAESVRRVLPPQALAKFGAPMPAIPPALAPPATAAAATAPADPSTSATAPATAAAAAPATPAAPVSPLAAGPLSTLPTGYADGPRRWFVSARIDQMMLDRKDRAMAWPSSSHFDHRAHRMVSCLDCHGQAKASESTRDVLMPAMKSCTGCHAPKTVIGTTGAESRCQVCHNYHDRSKERPIDGRFRAEQLIKAEPSDEVLGRTRPPAQPSTRDANSVAADSPGK